MYIRTLLINLVYKIVRFLDPLFIEWLRDEKFKRPDGEKTQDEKDIEEVLNFKESIEKMRNPTYVTVHPVEYESFKNHLQNNRSLFKIETYECRGCLDTGHYIKADEPDKLYFCTACNRDGLKYDYGNKTANN